MESVVSIFNVLKATYGGKKIFITGHTGFKGSWLLNLLYLLGAKVRGYALAPNNENDLYHLIKGDQLCDSIISDIRDKEKLRRAILEFEPDFIFHLAAQPLVRLSYQLPADTFEVNTMGTAYLLDALREVEGHCIAVLITTDKVYHNYETLSPYKEEARLGGYDPYSASKACSEIVIDSYRNSFFNINSYSSHQKAIAVARAGNVIGGGDWSTDRLVPDIVRALIQNNPISIRNPESIRPWQHVMEPVIGYLRLGMKLAEDPNKHAKAYNFGPEPSEEFSVKQMVQLAINCWGNGSYTLPKIEKQPHEAGILKLDISMAKEELEWFPKLTAVDAIGMTLDWYLSYIKDPKGIHHFTDLQILNFLHE